MYVGLAPPLLPTLFPTGFSPKCYNFVYSCKNGELFSGKSEFATTQNMSEERRNKLGKGVKEEQVRKRR